MSTSIQSLYRITSDVYWAIVASSSVESLCRITSDWVTVTSPRTILFIELYRQVKSMDISYKMKYIVILYVYKFL